MECIRLTDGSHSIDYLEKAVSFIESAATKPGDWVWAVLAVHGALYGFMICNMKGTDPDSACTGEKKKRLINFNEALNRCQDPAYMNHGGFNKVLQLSENQKRGLRKLSDFRNEFVHYKGAFWSIPEATLRETLMHAWDVLDAVRGMGCFYPRFEPGDGNRIVALVAKGKDLLQRAVCS
jgi:hypothetical protein